MGISDQLSRLATATSELSRDLALGLLFRDTAVIFLAAFYALYALCGFQDRASNVNEAASCIDAGSRRVKTSFLCFQMVEDFLGTSGTHTVVSRQCPQLALCLGSSARNLEIIWLGFDTLVLSFQLTFL